VSKSYGVVGSLFKPFSLLGLFSTLFQMWVMYSPQGEGFRVRANRKQGEVITEAYFVFEVALADLSGG